MSPEEVNETRNWLVRLARQPGNWPARQLLEQFEAKFTADERLLDEDLADHLRFSRRLDERIGGENTDPWFANARALDAARSRWGAPPTGGFSRSRPR